MKKPNLIYVFADQMRGCDMGCAGNEEVITPNIDRMAGEGVLFQNAVSVFPVCTPNRASLISGKYPHSVDVLDNDVPLPITGQGFGHTLKANGYKTGWVGKWHLFGPEAFRLSYIPPGEHRHGFDDLWAGVNCTHQYMDQFIYINDDPRRKAYTGYEPDIQTDIALEFIQENKEEPFALFVSFGPPHDPYELVPDKYKELYKDRKVSFRANVKTEEPFRTDIAPGNMGDNPHWDILAFYNHYSEENKRAYPDPAVQKDYYGAITALDHNMGKLMDRLEKLGIADDTIIVFSSDHGDMMYSQRSIQKGYPWEESLNIPFVLRYPKAIESDSKVTKPFNTVDIMPTILDLMGIEIPDFCEGTSFGLSLMGQEQDLPEAAYVMSTMKWNIPEWRAIRTENHTYVETLEGPCMMFDNVNDPYQLNNLIDDPANTRVKQELKTLYDQMATDVKDPFDSWETVDARMKAVNEVWMNEYGEAIRQSNKNLKG